MMSQREFTIGFVVNPIAGMGGSVGLKGTDGEILDQAIALGAVPSAGQRGIEFLQALEQIYGRATFITAGGVMGEACFEALDNPDISVEIVPAETEAQVGQTTPRDTIDFVRVARDRVTIIAFVGGDGTARDVLEGLGMDTTSHVPVIGIPAGVKIHSGVFAIHPADAASIVLAYLAGQIGTGEAEVMDIDEDAFRDNRLDAKLHGYLLIPQAPAFLQGTKEGSATGSSEEENKDRIAEFLVAKMDPVACYIIGPGSTTKPILDKLGLSKTLLGVDAVLGGRQVGTDMNEAQLLDLIGSMKEQGTPIELVTTVIGNQGFLFGRGNLQFSPAVIREIGLDRIRIVMTLGKFATLPGGKLRNDTHDSALDAEMKGFYRVLVDEGEYRIVEVT
jgi:predicted polyphosphate/ATP-dependent NAD kinase